MVEVGDVVAQAVGGVPVVFAVLSTSARPAVGRFDGPFAYPPAFLPPLAHGRDGPVVVAVHREAAVTEGAAVQQVPRLCRADRLAVDELPAGERAVVVVVGEVEGCVAAAQLQAVGVGAVERARDVAPVALAPVAAEPVQVRLAGEQPPGGGQRVPVGAEPVVVPVVHRVESCPLVRIGGAERCRDP